MERWLLAVQVEAEKEARVQGFDPRKQKTLKQSASISGTGLFTAEKATVTLHPAAANSGVVFIRSDLPGRPRLPADLDHVVGTPRCTILGNAFCTIHTVEHVLSALKGMGVDNVIVELSGPEVPIIDGSSGPFVALIQKGQIEELDVLRKIHELKTPMGWSKGDVHLVALPSKAMQVSYTLHFPQSTRFRSQYLSTRVDPDSFASRIAPCRTFSFYEEIAPFVENGLIKGGGLDNAVIIKNDAVVNPEGMRFPDEMVGHKVLDLVGDLSLIPEAFAAHIIAVRSGHASNVAFASKLYNHIKMEKSLYAAG